MLTAEGRIVIDCTPREALEFVLDLQRYAEADTKIGKVLSLEPTGEHEWATRYRGRFLGLPAPADRQVIRLVPWERLTVTSLPSLFPGLFYRFEGSFACEPVEAGGTLVVHRETLHFRRPLRRLMDLLIGRWFRRQIDGEMARMKRLLEAGS